MSYEFNSDEDKVVKGLARKLRLVSLVLIVLGLLAGVLAGLEIKNTISELGAKDAFMGNLVMIVTALLLLLFGIWFSGSATSFAKIAKTEGDDMNHLMKALGSLSSAFGLIYWAIIIAILAAVGMIIYTLATGGSAGELMDQTRDVIDSTVGGN